MIKEHPLRHAIVNEIHARPFAEFSVPAQISYLAMTLDDASADDVRDHLAKLCEARGADLPAPDSHHHFFDVGDLRVRWEQHSEFYSISFVEAGRPEIPFRNPPVMQLDSDWVSELPGSMISATNILVESDDEPERRIEDLGDYLTQTKLVGSVIAGGGALFWTDFDIHDDGFGRMIVRNVDIGPRQMGRVLRRLLEIETYRSMAMLAFPAAKLAIPTISKAEEVLGDLVEEMADEQTDSSSERRLLDELSGLAAEIELSIARTSFRVSAAHAYEAIVRSRIEELREDRMPGLQLTGEFLLRRLSPAMATIESLSKRQDDLSHRIGRATDLLRTRINVNLEEQNQKILNSMDERASMQLRLQRTVEGLSVVAISYYAVSLILYGAKAAKGAGLLPVAPEVVAGLALPFVLLLVWRAVRAVRHALIDK